MKRTRLMVLGVATLLLIVLTVSAVLTWEPVAWVALGLLGLLILALQIDNRRALTKRVQNAGLRIERQLAARPVAPVDPGPGATPTVSETTASPTAPAASPTDVAHTGGRQAPPGSPGSLSVGDGVAAILSSGIFDLEFYGLQVGRSFTGSDEAVRHYLQHGRQSGRLPHPLFSPALRDPSTWHKANQDPLSEYLRHPAASKQERTHLLFDPEYLDLTDLPEHETALAWFLRTSSENTPLPTDPVVFRSDVTLSEFRRSLVERHSRILATRERYMPLVGASKAPTPEPWVQDAVDALEESTERPLVSIVLPTWNRAGSLRAAIESVQAQTYPYWELLIADDGSMDDTALAVQAESERDDRLKLLTLSHRGVSAARNAAIAAASGRYIAFLDSDKVWDRQFLRTMVSVLESTAHRAVVAGTEITLGSEVIYRTVQPTIESLRLGNSVDQTAIVAAADLVRQIGGFDESLRRAVDYDLILKIAEVVPLHAVPYIGVRYSEDNTDPHRISEFESKAWNFHVAGRAAWDRFEQSGGAAAPVPGLVSIIVDDVRQPHRLDERVAELMDATEGQQIELIVAAGRFEWSAQALLAALDHAHVEVTLIDVGLRTDRPGYVNDAIRAARGETVLILEAHHAIHRGSLEALLDLLQGAAAVHPVVLGRTLLIENAGMVYPRYGSDPVPFLRNLPLDVLHARGPVTVPGAPFPLLARRRDLLAVRGATTLLSGLWADVDLSQKLAQATGMPVVTTAELVVQATRGGWTARTSTSADDVRTFRELWPHPPSSSTEACRAVEVSPQVYGFDSVSVPTEPDTWTSAGWVPGHVQVVEHPDRLRWALRTAVPADERAANWGDWHYANSLAEALRRLGQDVLVDFQPNARRGTAGYEDVVVNLRGLREIPLPGGATTVLWVISHPEQVSAKELAAYDLRYAASAIWSARATAQTGHQVDPLLQCTDPARFFPDDETLEDLTDSIVMVGNSRKQYRPAAWHAANAGLPVRVWGTDWEDQVPPECIAGTTVPNDVLRRHYRSAAWVLNDHWPEMREDGFVSNRIFDVLASRGRLVTDDVGGLSDIFGDRLQVFQSPIELLKILAKNPAAAYPPDLLRELSTKVRAEHSFDARAARLLKDVRALRAEHEVG